MITVEEKLNTFSKIVFDQVQEEADQQLRQIKEKNKEILHRHTRKIDEQAEGMLDKKVKAGKNKKRQMVSKASIQVKNNILNKKKELMDTLIQGMISRTKEFVTQKPYGDFLMAGVKEASTYFNRDDDVSIYLTERDIGHFQGKIVELLEEWGFKSGKIQIHIMGAESLGGFIMISETEGIRLDASIKTSIENEKEHIGQILYEALAKVGDEDD